MPFLLHQGWYGNAAAAVHHKTIKRELDNIFTLTYAPRRFLLFYGAPKVLYILTDQRPLPDPTDLVIKAGICRDVVEVRYGPYPSTDVEATLDTDWQLEQHPVTILLAKIVCKENHAGGGRQRGQERRTL